ncbi:MAG: tetratricopeptide repeat protein [Acidobacteriaceae bacterium]
MTGHDLPAARANFERALQTDPDYVPAELDLGVLCMQAGDVPCARTAFHAFLKKAPPAQYKETIPRVQYALRTVLAERK